jgi:hypothetical protein
MLLKDPMRRRSSISQLLIAALFCALAGSAAAQTYGVGVSGSQPNLGEVASAASGTTVFRVTASTAAVSRLSGAGQRVSFGTTRATVTISCGTPNACNTDDVYIRIGAGSTTGRGRALTNFNVSMGTAVLKSGPTGTNPINFRIGPIGKNSSKTFYVGADFPIAGDESGSGTGAASASFYVWADDVSTPDGSQSGSGTAVATVFRSLAMTKTSDLTFGRIVRPVTGAGGAVSLAASNAARSAPAGVAWLNLPIPTRAAYTVTGEGGQTLAISVPANFTMTGPSGSTVTVTTNSNVVATPTLSSILGNAGSYSFFVGGSFPVTPATSNGAYTGSFTVTAAYN